MGSSTGSTVSRPPIGLLADRPVARTPVAAGDAWSCTSGVDPDATSGPTVAPMTEDDVIALVRSLPGARADTVGEGSGAPEIAWGDTFAYVDPEDRRHLERWFPPCPPDRHREIAAAYLGSDDGDSDGDSAWEDIARATRATSPTRSWRTPAGRRTPLPPPPHRRPELVRDPCDAGGLPSEPSRHPPRRVPSSGRVVRPPSIPAAPRPRRAPDPAHDKEDSDRRNLTLTSASCPGRRTRELIRAQPAAARPAVKNAATAAASGSSAAPRRAPNAAFQNGPSRSVHGPT